MNDLINLDVTPFEVYDRLKEIVNNKAYGRYKLPNGEVLPVNELFNMTDVGNAASRCKIVYILSLR